MPTGHWGARRTLNAGLALFRSDRAIQRQSELQLVDCGEASDRRPLGGSSS